MMQQTQVDIVKLIKFRLLNFCRYSFKTQIAVPLDAEFFIELFTEINSSYTISVTQHQLHISGYITCESS